MSAAVSIGGKRLQLALPGALGVSQGQRKSVLVKFDVFVGNYYVEVLSPGVPIGGQKVSIPLRGNGVPATKVSKRFSREQMSCVTEWASPNP
jgi:hypothetical protein